MILGRFRDGHPRATVMLPTATGPIQIEFIIDTGFEGDLAIPAHLARPLGDGPAGFRRRALADGSVMNVPFQEVWLEWQEAERLTEVLILEGQPLLGMTFLEGCFLQIEVAEGGEVLAEPI